MVTLPFPVLEAAEGDHTTGGPLLCLSKTPDNIVDRLCISESEDMSTPTASSKNFFGASPFVR